ncbi:hypothetical protein V1639_09175 [Pseudarthrobacter sp. J75]|uniref:hypothetical protein n=1 Tax=unclassified Pseudarthrobacter TaxID=2647000 RepID=UPI002E7FEA9A|nr:MULTISPECIES: hypothetical protein [unclassified Pseudarthrobacter]MEE2522472.1 hypothetical protein [Pseudarthrobacter sp. J47]MEE2529197.1 hypothetical protein [Pseudarthrobacter sp. J75]
MPIDLSPAPRSRRRSFSVAMRMARRDIRRHWGRSLLIVLLIMLPVAGMTGAVTLVQSGMETPAERVEYQLGQAQARYRSLTMGSAQAVQDPVIETVIASNPSSGWDPDFVGADPADILPAGFSVLTESAFPVRIESGKDDVPVMGSAVDALNPAFTGKFTLLRGRAPSAAGEALVSPGMLDKFKLRLGDEFTTSAGTFAAVGTVRDAGLSDGNAILYLAPGQVPDSGTAGSPVLYYLVGPRPVTWDQVRSANTVGVVVLSRHVALNPPPLDQRTVDGSLPQYSPYVPLDLYLTGAYTGALALLEVGLLAGAAFAVGAKRQVRELALLGASGADAPTVRAVVTAAGFWLGGLGVVAGAAAGMAGAAGVVFLARAVGSVRFPGFHPDWLLTAAAMGMGFLACVLAAQAPARQISRQAALGALKSGRAPSTPPRRSARIGFCILLLSVGLLLAGVLYATSTEHPDVVAARFPWVAGLLISGGVLAVVAMLFLSGPLVSQASQRVGWLPLSARMAFRDAARNLGRTVPAVGAVLAAATLAGAGMVLSASQFERSVRTASAPILVNQAQLPLVLQDPSGSSETATRIQPDRVVAVVSGISDSLAWTQVLNHPRAIQNCETRPDADVSGPPRTAEMNCLKYSVAVPPGNECILTEEGRIRYPGDWRCIGPMGYFSGGGWTDAMLVGGADEIRATFGREATPEALDVLEGGGIVLANPVYENHGSAVILADDIRKPQESAPGTMRFEPASSMELPAMVLEPASDIRLYGVVSPATAERLGMQPEATMLRLQFDSYPSDEELDALRSEVNTIYGSGAWSFHVQQASAGGQDVLIWGIVGLAALITLSAAGITTGLSLADARTDHMTLAGVGASPGLRKALAGSQALLTVGLGTVLGAVAGVVPMVLILASADMKPFIAVPWLQVSALIVLVPLAAAALAWLFTRAQLPMSRRAAGT